MLIEGLDVSPSIFLAGKDSGGIHLLLNVRRKLNALELLAIFIALRDNDNDAMVMPESIIRSLSASAFALVWSSPAAFFWTRIAYGFIHASDADIVPARFAQWIGVDKTCLLDALADRLWLLAIAGLICDRRNYIMPRPLKLPVRGSLPTLPIAWMSQRQFWIKGIENGYLLVVDESGSTFLMSPDNSIDGLQIVCKPLLDEDAELYLDLWSEYVCADYHGLESTERVSADSDIKAQSQIFKKALSDIKRAIPELHSEILKLLRTMTPLKPVGSGLPSSSNSSITGAIWYTATDISELVAEMIIHEHTHNKLFLLQDIDPLIEPNVHGTAWESCKFYSPWRDDPRPLNGIFHGYVVFSEVALFWSRRLALNNTDNVGLRRFGMLVRQLQVARKVLEEHCTFTPVGMEIMKLLSDRLNYEFIPLAELFKTDTLPILHMERNNDFTINVGSNISDAVGSHLRQWEAKNLSELA